MMDYKNPKFYLIVLATFIIVFLMNYVGNSGAPDRLPRAVMTGASAAIFLIIGLFISKKTKPDDRDKFDFD